MRITDVFINELTTSFEGTSAVAIEPVFVIGSYRSGTSILTWALGQHPDIFPLEETNWIYRMSIYLDCLYKMGTVNGQNSHLSGMAMSRTHFYKTMGILIDSFILGNRVRTLKSSLSLYLKKNNLPPLEFEKLNRVGDFARFTDQNALFSLIRNEDDAKTRWIDGTPENSHFVYSLNMMFPKAKFIFLIRNPIRVAHSLMNFVSVDGQSENYDEKKAYEQWYSLTQSCYFALKAFGTAKILLIQQEELLTEKEAVIAKCLSFLGEEYNTDCLKPLQMTINSSQYDKTEIDFSTGNGLKSEKKYVVKACQLYNRVINDPFYKNKGTLHYYRMLRNRYIEQAGYFY